MKRRIFTIALLAMLTLTASAQNTTTFLGIAVEGSKAEMTKKLLENGAVRGKNGLEISGIDDVPYLIKIHTNRGKVYRLSLIESKGTEDVSLAIAKYNALLDWYKNSPDYAEYEYNRPADGSDNLKYENYVHQGVYYAEFFQQSDPQLYNRRVGFQITDAFGDYRIERMYDNIYNMPKGR